MTVEQFLSRAYEKHGNKFLYPDLPEKIMDRTKVLIECAKHGKWYQRAGSHIREGYGCSKCTNLLRYGVDHPMKVADTANSAAKKAQDKRQKTFDDKYGGHPMKCSSISKKASDTWKAKSKENIVEIMNKKAKTFINKYGYDNPFNDAAVKESIYELRRERGDWTPDDKLSGFRLYKRTVLALTERSWRTYQDTINPNALERGEFYHLDHRFSITEGFRLEVDPIIISHPVNLEIIDATVNKSKGRKCSIELSTLLEMINEFDHLNTS